VLKKQWVAKDQFHKRRLPGPSLTREPKQWIWTTEPFTQHCVLNFQLFRPLAGKKPFKRTFVSFFNALFAHEHTGEVKTIHDIFVRLVQRHFLERDAYSR
jgi:hypothetical protein